MIVALAAGSRLSAPVVFDHDSDDQAEPLESNDDLSIFPQPIECKPDEEPNVGKLPECEPTCDNPRPICLKIFHIGLDIAPCFCKSPMVRDVKGGNKCVPRSACPPKQ